MNTVPLKQLLEQINLTLKAQNNPPLSNAAIGQATGFSKSTITALLNGKYTPTTKGRIQIQVQQYLKQRYKEANAELGSASCVLPITQIEQPAKVNRRKRAGGAFIRVGHTGFFKYRGKHYHAGSNYASSLCEVSADGEDDSVTITNGRSKRVLFPIDPTGNQVGYTPSGGKEAA